MSHDNPRVIVVEASGIDAIDLIENACLAYGDPFCTTDPDELERNLRAVCQRLEPLAKVEGTPS